MTRRNSVARFNDRVENYRRHRPRYPQAILPFLEREIGLEPGWEVADIGSGTGLLAELFVQYGCTVTGVEPNPGMRAAGDEHLAGYGNFRSVDGLAEATGLPAHSVDMVTVGQAFHWFEPERARREFQRILRPGGWVVLVWNSRVRRQSPVVDAYEALLESLHTDYRQVAEQNAKADRMSVFFSGIQPFQEIHFDNPQRYTWEQFLGRALSSSYAPLPPDPGHQPFVTGLRDVFDRFAQGEFLHFPMDTNLYWGRLS